MNWLDELQREVDAAFDLVRLVAQPPPFRARPIMTLGDEDEPESYFPYEEKKAKDLD